MPYDPPRKRTLDDLRTLSRSNLCTVFGPAGRANFFGLRIRRNPTGPTRLTISHRTHLQKGPEGRPNSFSWLKGVTRPPAFPDAEVMDGCRKAPIMTIGINPNLTAFAPGRTGAAWCYPSFSSADSSDTWTKYAYYYRYRSVYQEHFDLKFIEPFLLPEGSDASCQSGRHAGVFPCQRRSIL